MPDKFVLWVNARVPGGCVLDILTGYEDTEKLVYGDSVEDEFPKTAKFGMNPDLSTNIGLTDSLRNTDRLVVASERLTKFLEARELPHVEYLPVKVFNHKQRAVKEKYWIVHPVSLVDCLVVNQCKPRWSEIDKTSITRLKKLVIDESKIPADRQFFRPKFYRKVIVVRRDLAKAITGEGFSGVEFQEIREYSDA